MLIADWLKSLQRRPRQIQQRVQRSRSRARHAAGAVEYLEDRTLLTSPLNSVIDALLNANDGAGQSFDRDAGPTEQDFVFTTDDENVPSEIVVGEDSAGQADLELGNVRLTFRSGLEYSNGSWTGQVGVEALSGTLYPELLDIEIADDGTDTDGGDDADEYAVTGVIDLATGTPANLNLDNLDAADIGLPAFLDIAITDLELKFDDFRGDDTENTLELDASFGGIKTGSETLDAQLESDLVVTGGVTGLELDMSVIKTGVRDLANGDISFPSSPIVDLDGVSGAIEGELFAAEVSGSFIVNTVSVDPDGAGPKAEESVLYAALQGSIEIEEIASFGFAFAFSELGPLQIFGHSDVAIPLETQSGLVATNLRLGARFSTTIEDLQTETDFTTDRGTFDQSNSQVTLRIPDHDLVAGNTFRVRNADTESYDGEFTVLSVNGDDVTYAVDADPGLFVGDAEILRLTITDPLDLRDSGLSAGIAPPEDVADWQSQLDQAVTNQIEGGDDVWGRLFDEFVLGGGATLSFDPRIPSDVLEFDADFMLGSSFDGDDVSLALWFKGEMSLYDGAVTIPASVYGDLGTSDEEFSGQLLFLAEVSPNVPDVDIDPLLVYRGEATFETLDSNNDGTVDGFSIGLAGAVDLNIPNVTTLTLEGSTSIDFVQTDTVLAMDLEFSVMLSETNVGTIASADGAFHATIDTTTAAVDVWGAAILGTNLGFLNEFGLFANAFGLLRINTADMDKPDEVLTGPSDNEVIVALPAESFALRLDGSVDFRMDHNSDDTFASTESVFQIVGTFVLEFSPSGFNVALFREAGDTVVPATLKLGAAGNTLIEFGVLGFLGIRDNGFAADLVLTVDASLPLGLADITGAAVLVVNTTKEEVVFDIPGSADPNRSEGLTITIPAAAPADPAAILGAPGPGDTPSGLDTLISGSPTWTEGAAGAYGVVFVDAQMSLLDILEFDVSGYVLMSEEVVSLQMNLYAGGNFLGLASGSVSGSLFFSSEGEFEASIAARAQFGPDWININGGADLTISYLDDNGTASGGNKDFELDIAGRLAVGLTIDISPFPSIDVSLDALTVAYNSASGNITVGVTYPEPFWDEFCVDLGWFGNACFPYPNVRTATYSFTVGTLTLSDPPPPPVLGQVSDSGVLTINAGSAAVRTLRNLRTDEINESVTIESIGPMVNGEQTITVRMFDVTQTFEGVRSINIPDMNDGNDSVEIGFGVSVPGNVHLGAGDDRLINRGSGAIVAYGGAGADRLRGSSASEQLFGGAGDDVIEGGGGSDTIRGGIGDDTLLVAVRGNEPQNINVSISNTGFTANIGDDPLDPIADIENLNIENAANRTESDTFTITYANDTSGSVLDQVNVHLGDDNIQDTVIVNGSNVSDTFDISTSVVTRRVTVPTGNGTETETTETDVDSVRVTQRGGVNLDIYDVGSAFGADTVTVNGLGGSDAININSTLTGITTTVNGGDGSDTINVGSDVSQSISGDLEAILGSLVVNGNDGADILSLDDTSDTEGDADGRLTATTISGSGIGSGITYASIDTLNINLGSAADTFVVSGTHSAATRINTGDGTDTVDIESTSGVTTVSGAAGDDNLRVNETAGTEFNTLSASLVLDGQTGADSYDINIFGNGGSLVSVFDSGSSAAETDTLRIDGTDVRDDFILRASNTSGVAFVAAVHGDQAERINYDARLENLIVDAAAGTDYVTLGRVDSGFASDDETNPNASVLQQLRVDLGDDNVQDHVVFNGSSLADTFDISATAGVLSVDRRGDVRVNIHEAGTANETVTVNTQGAADTINVDSTSSGVTTTINGGADLDTINVGSQATTSGSGNLDGIVGSLVVNGENGADVLNLDDTSDVTGDIDGRLTATAIAGSGIGSGITYSSIDGLNINLGSGADAFLVNSTHAQNTRVDAGDGNDTIDVESVSGTTTILGAGGDDFLRINNVVGSETNGLSAVVVLDGQAGNDNYDVNIFGNGESLVSVSDSGASATEIDTLTIHGTDGQDDFVLRASNDAGAAFVAAVHNDQAERIDYDTRVERLIVDAAGGTDLITLGRGESNFAIGDETSTNASVLDRVNVRLGDDSVQDNVVFNGAGVADTFDISADTDAILVARRGAVSLDIHESGTSFGADAVTVNTQGAADTVNVNSTLAGTATIINGGEELDTINVGSKASTSGGGDLEGVSGSLIVNGNGGADVLNLDDTGDAAGDRDGHLTATTIAGSGIGAGVAYDSIDALNISLGSGADTFNVTSTHSGTTNIRGGGGNDTIDIESVVGDTTVLGENGDDTLRVNNVTGTEANGLATTLVLDGQAGSDNYDINIFGNGDSLVTVFDSGPSASETDTLTVDGTENRDDFVLRASNTTDNAFVAALHGDQTERVNYNTQLEALIVDTAGGTDHVTLGRGENGFAIGDETNTDMSVLQNVNVRLGDDSVQDSVVVHGSSAAETFDISTNADIYRVARRDGVAVDIHEAGMGADAVSVNAHGATDLINVEGTLAGTTTTLNGGTEVDTVNIGSRSSESASGDLEGIAGSLVVNGNDGDDILNLDDTGDTAGDSDGQLTATTIAGSGIGAGITYDSIDTINVGLGSGADSFKVYSTHAGTTNVRGGGGNDTINVESITGATNVLGEGGDDTLQVNSATAAESNGLATTLVLDGQAGNDNYEVNIFGNGDSLVTVFDSGTENSEIDTLTVNGTDDRDDFLLRASNNSSASGGVAFVAALHDDLVERVNYDEQLENLIVETADADDHVTLDDNWAETTVRGGAGEDEFQVGQIFQSSRDAAEANIANEDKFATVETIRGFLSNGVSSTTTIEGGGDADVFVVFRNAAELNLDGQDGDDLFTLRSFAEEGSFESSIELGSGGDTVEYIGNADLDVNGGAGNDMLRVIGTEFSDRYLVTADSVRGAGRTITYETVEVLEIDAGEGDDEFFVFSTPAGLTTRLSGGLGSDQFHIGGDSKAVQAENDSIVDATQGPHDLAGILGPLEIDGFSDAGSSGAITAPVMLPAERNHAESDGQVIAHSGTGEAGTLDAVTLLTADLQAVVDADSSFAAIADLVGRTLTITDGPGLHRFWQIVAIAGGADSQSDLTLKNLSLSTRNWGLPDATSAFAVSSLSSNFFVDESLTTDVVTVFDDGSLTGDTGSLSATTITGLGASGAVTYSNFEIMHILLGAGDDSFEVTGVADGTVAAVHGGGGSDSITVTGRGDLPLAVYGDTSEDGGLFTSTTGTIEPGLANSFANNGGDTIDASGSSQNVLLYGGPGNDTLTGSQSGDHLAGGAGNDHINGESGDDNIYGDSSFNVSSELLAEDQITPFDPTTADGLAKINATFEIVTTAVPGDDTIDGGEDQDTIFGDYGVITRFEGTRRIWSTDADSVLKIETTNVTLGGNDSVSGSGGDDFLFGGLADDTVSGGDGYDIVLGDHGIVDLVTNDNDNSTVDIVESTHPLLGGNDSLLGGADKDILFGGTANDAIMAGSGNDVALGDHGLFDYSLDPNQNFVSIFTTDATGAGDDTLHGQNGNDFLLGQQGNDSLHGGAGEDDLTGGHNVLFGADGDDVIDGDADADVILGDNGIITRTLLDGEDAAWHTYPAPFADVIRDVQRFDNVDLVAGNDTVLGGPGRDILQPQRGDDNVDGGADDDEIIGSEGNDTLAGGDGADFILGDNGQIHRAFNADGTPQINGHGIWQRDIVLEEFASISGTIDLDRTPEQGSEPLAAEILHADIVVLSGAFDDDGNRVRNADNNAWDTDLLLLNLTAAGNDVIDGGEGEDVILGQRGDDNISGGGGADLIVGDNATSLVQFESTMPQIIHGIRVLDVATEVPIDIDFGGSVIVPEIAVTPQDLSLTKPIADVVTDVSPELRQIALDASLSTTDGRSLVPYISIVPDITRHADVLAGSDTIDGGAGDDAIYGDNLSVFAQPHDVQARIDVANNNVSKRLEDVNDAVEQLTLDFDMVEAGLFGATNDGVVHIANDSISGGDGNDTIVGDDGTIITPASSRSAIDVDNYEADAVARLEHLQNVKHLLIDFELTLEEANVELVTLLVDDALANNPNRTRIAVSDVVQLQHQNYVMQSDVIAGGAGDDTIIGDHSLVIVPAASSLEIQNEQSDPQTIPQEIKTQTNLAMRTIENERRIELRDHLRNDHDTSAMPHRRDRRLIPYKLEYNVSMSNDVLNGDAGADVIVGDRGETVVPVLLDAPARSLDAIRLNSAINFLSNSLALRSLLDTDERDNHTEHRYFTGFEHNSKADIPESIGLDTIDGGANDDVLLGDHAELNPVFVQGTPLSETGYVANPIELFEGSDDVIRGGSGNDIVFAQMGDDTIHGDAGNDTLYGGRGQDELFGDDGADELRGGSHRDVINRDVSDIRALQGGGNGTASVAVPAQAPWGELVSELYFNADTIDPNTDLWATFAQGTDWPF